MANAISIQSHEKCIICSTIDAFDLLEPEQIHTTKEHFVCS